MGRLGLILGQEVAGRGRLRPEKWLLRGRGRGERKLRERGERREGFRKWKPYPINITISGNFPKIPLRLLLTITSSYELRFLCTSCLRTRFNTYYNFREENIFKFHMTQKVNSRTHQNTLKFVQIKFSLLSNRN